MSTLINHAKVELESAGLFDEDSDYGGLLGKAVLELVEVFSNQGHSGMSASIVRNIFNKVADFKPLGPLTGEDKEWADSCDGEMFQNKRCSAVFKDGKEGTPYYLDAIVWRGGDYDDSFTGSVEEFQSRQFLKFPFVPKTFYIDVVKTEFNPEVDKDHYEADDGSKYVYRIKDRKQLEKVWEHYINPEEVANGKAG